MQPFNFGLARTVAFGKLLVAMLLLTPGLALAAGEPDAALSKLCRTGSSKPAADPRIHSAIAQAWQQHTFFGGQTISRDGALESVGYHEAEYDPDNKKPPTWKRVADFWAALGDNLPMTFRSPEEPRVNRKVLFEQLALHSEGNPGARLSDHQVSALKTAFLRSALVDHPWSAAFISYLMSSSGFKKMEFEFSEGHVDYVEKAVLSSSAEINGSATGYAFRVCDPSTTKPRSGDLLCYTREGKAATRTYAAMIDDLARRRAEPKPGAYAMHCDLVVSADDKGNAKIETIGGNVFQSVTLRKMTLNESRTLSAKFIALAPEVSCERGEECSGNLSRKPWVVLLQFRL